MVVRKQRHAGRARTFLKEWREYRYLTQEQAAERIGVDQGTLSRLERGVSGYSQDFLELAAYAYMCEPADLIMRDPNSPIWSIVDTLKQVPPEDQAQIVKIIATFRKAS